MSNIIPPISHEMGRSWRQPPVDDILIDDTHAVMSPGSFRSLCEYNTTNPSGVYEGKMWKRQIFQHGPYGEMRPYKPPLFHLCWFGESDRPGMVSNNTRILLVA